MLSSEAGQNKAPVRGAGTVIQPQSDELSTVSAADYLKARDIVAREIQKRSQVQANTRREIAEGLMSKGWLNVKSILETQAAEDAARQAAHEGLE